MQMCGACASSFCATHTNCLTKGMATVYDDETLSLPQQQKGHFVLMLWQGVFCCSVCMLANCETPSCATDLFGTPFAIKKTKADTFYWGGQGAAHVSLRV